VTQGTPRCDSRYTIARCGSSPGFVIQVTEPSDDDHRDREGVGAKLSAYSEVTYDTGSARIAEASQVELKFVEDGGYGRSPRTPWRAPSIFEDSPSCLNLGDPARSHPCSECLLMRLVPGEVQSEESPCRFIPLNEKGQTIDYFTD